MPARVVAAKGKEQKNVSKQLKETKSAKSDANEGREMTWDAVHESLEELSDVEKLAHCFKTWKRSMPALKHLNTQAAEEEKNKKQKGPGGKYSPDDQKGGGKRFSLQDKRAVEELMIKEAFKSQDKSKKGLMQREELRQLMTGIAEGKPPDDYEVEFIFRTAHCEKDEIDERGVLHGIKVWRTQTDIREHVDCIFDRFDTDGSGKLDHTKMKRLLVELNEGDPVSDKEVEKVIEDASVVKHRDSVVGVITKIECMSAVAAWYAHQEEKEKRKGLRSAISRMCTVM